MRVAPRFFASLASMASNEMRSSCQPVEDGVKMKSLSSEAEEPQTAVVPKLSQARKALNESHTSSDSSNERASGGRLSPIRALSYWELSTRVTESEGACARSEMAVAEPPGPPPTIVTSEFISQATKRHKKGYSSSVFGLRRVRSTLMNGGSLGGGTVVGVKSPAGLLRTTGRRHHSVTILRSPALVCGTPGVQSSHEIDEVPSAARTCS